MSALDQLIGHCGGALNSDFNACSQAELMRRYFLSSQQSMQFNSGMQAAALDKLMAQGIANTPEPRLARARRIAAEVRAAHPEMQVRRIKP